MQVDISVRTAASVTLKNELRQHWEESDEVNDVSNEAASSPAAAAASAAAVYGEEEKQQLRNTIYSIIKALKPDAAPVRLQLIECVRIIALHDYPDKSASP